MFRTDSSQIAKILHQLRVAADKAGLPFGDRKMTYNSRLAQELGIWAEDQGQGHSFHMAAFRAYFAHGKNLANHNVLFELVEQCGLSAGDATEILSKRSYSDRVDRDWAKAREMQVTAVPTLVIGGQQLVGARDYRSMQGLMLQHGIRRRR